MNIVTEPKLSGKPIADKPHKRPVRLVRWFLIVGLLLAAIVSGLGFFKFVFLPNLFKEIFSKPPPPTSSASSSPTMMNQRTIRTGRFGGFSTIGLPEIFGSVTMFMSCTFCSYRLSRYRRQRAVQM